MPTLRSHTHLQATQADTQAKACKRVCLFPRTDRKARSKNERHNNERQERPACNTG